MPKHKAFDWHLLDGRAIWVKELAAALAKSVSLLAWIPEISWTGFARSHSRAESLADPPLTLRSFPLQRGFARTPLRWFIPEGRRIRKRLLAHSNSPAQTVLLCASPQYALAARDWPGPVIYYMSDLYYAWGDHPEYVNYFDRLMCRRADLVCPVSQRGKDYLRNLAGCPEDKIAIFPMATRAANIQDAPSTGPQTLPADMQDLARPVLGIIGNLAANTDWLFLRQAIRLLPGFSWVFVGSTEMPVEDADQRQARDELREQGGNVRFLGYRPYGELAAYARSFDAAVLPYRRREPTFSGSSTRFYEHLAAGRPMFATLGFAELLTKEPLVHLVGSADELAARITSLQKTQFIDGVETRRWEASRWETWDARAKDMRQALAQRIRTGI